MRGNITLRDVGLTDSNLNAPGDGGDIWLRTGSFADSAANNMFISTMLHEIGHALGLSHPSFGDAQDKIRYMVEGYDFDGLEAPTKLQLYDISALQYLYGAATNRNEGNNSGNTNTPTAMIAEKAATMILEDARR